MSLLLFVIGVLLVRCFFDHLCVDVFLLWAFCVVSGFVRLVLSLLLFVVLFVVVVL